MMFLADAAFALELLALVAGTYLLITSTNLSQYKKFTKFISYFVIVASFLGMLCTTIFVIKELMHGCCKADGQRNSWCPMRQKDMNTPQNMQEHMDGMMKQNP